ncbi:MAG: M20 family metallopeptidase [bacterium]
MAARRPSDSIMVCDSRVIQQDRLKRLLERMIDIYSPSGKEEEILEYLYGYLKRHGLPVQRQKVDEARYNLVIMPEGEVQVSFVGHLDTVIAYDLDHFGYTEEGDLISGLGSADMKGGCAAMIEAFIALWKRTPSPPPIALALVVGEEEEGDGARILANASQFNWAIIGEPTGLTPCLSHYGYLEIQLVAKGRRIHASLANQCQNPIEAMLRMIVQITHYIETSRSQLVYNIRDLFTTRAGFMVPDHCEAWLDVHMPPESPIGEIVAEIEELFEQERANNPHFDGNLRFLTIDAGYELPEKGPLVEALKGIYVQRSLPWEPGPFRSHSDANRLWASGVRPVLLGPGELMHSHTPDESISFRQVAEASEIYFALGYAIAEDIQ